MIKYLTDIAPSILIQSMRVGAGSAREPIVTFSPLAYGRLGSFLDTVDNR